MTGAEIVKTILDVVAANYPTYGSKPDVVITGNEDKFGMKEGSFGIHLKDLDEDPEFAHDNKEMFRNSYCEMMLIDSSKDNVENLFSDIKDLLQANTSYGITFLSPEREDKLTSFELLVMLKILN